jgi:hypothetical protein
LGNFEKIIGEIAEFSGSRGGEYEDGWLSSGLLGCSETLSWP